MPQAVLLLAIFITLFLLSAFFSISETALVAVNKIRLSHFAKQGSRRAKVAQELVLQLDQVIATVLVYNSLVNTAIAAIGTSLSIRLFGPEAGIIISTFIMTMVIVVFGEISPKVFAVSNADTVCLFIAYPMRLIVRFSTPVINIFTKVSNQVSRFFGAAPRSRVSLVTEEEMRFMIEAGKEEGIYGEMERKILHRIFEFGDLRVEDVMIPLSEIHSVPVTATERDLFNVCVEEGHSRVPVHKDSKENIVGIVYTKDLLHLLLNDQLIKIPDILNEPYVVLPAMKVSSLLKEFLHRKLQIAIVGEGSVAVGLVTLEDLLEEIVGEIDEEPKREPDPVS